MTDLPSEITTFHLLTIRVHQTSPLSHVERDKGLPTPGTGEGFCHRDHRLGRLRALHVHHVWRPQVHSS